jgi:uncharacterized protein YecT (DUF1311 family)
MRKVTSLIAITIVVSFCFASLAAFGEEDCDDYYFGINGPPQFSKAFKCYSKQKELKFLILMYLNGEGTPVNVRKAEEVFNQWQASAPEQAETWEGEALQNVIEERKDNPKGPLRRLVYCKDIAKTTLAMNDCAIIKERIAERKQKKNTDMSRAGMDAPDAAIFDKIEAEFEAFKKAESSRMYTKYTDGTIRDMAGLSQENFVRGQFLALVKKTLELHVLVPADVKALKAADDELNRVYRKDVQDYVSEYSDRLKDNDLKEWHDSYRKNINEYTKYAREAQRHWIKYRDLWAELASSIFRNGKAKGDPAIAIKTTLTKIRVKELHHDPVSPN